eukprot:COSAG03_NODE_21864_length_298_cov_0.939698_1_plen_80_part_01
MSEDDEPEEEEEDDDALRERRRRLFFFPSFSLLPPLPGSAALPAGPFPWPSFAGSFRSSSPSSCSTLAVRRVQREAARKE